MGWIRDLMNKASRPIPSYDALARAVLASPAWGDAAKPQSRSMAAVFSKLDRGQDLDWLTDRVHVQLALADVLSCSLVDLRAPLHESPSGSGARGRLRLDDLRYGQSIDLLAEALPPGIPEAVCDPAHWGRLWWVAPPGAGKTLVGEWLGARGLAHIRRTEGARAGRPVYWELGAGELGPDPGQAGAPLCIAAPFHPATAGWTVVCSPAVEDYADALVDWVAARLGGESRFDARAVKTWLARQQPWTDCVDSAGALLGLLGAIDEVGLVPSEGSTLLEIAGAWFEGRIEELVRPEGADFAWLRRHGLTVVAGLVRRLLTDPERPWSAPRTLDAWLEAVPVEFQREVDVDWLCSTLVEDKGPIRDRDVRRAARRLPPGAYRIVRGLQTARLLVELDRGQIVLRPRWFTRVVLAEVRRRLVKGSPFEYGEALLSRHAAEEVFAELAARIRREEGTPIEELLELDGEDEPTFVAALEGVVRGAGRCLLMGGELPAESLVELWREQSRCVVSLGQGPPQPRVGHDVPSGSWLSDVAWQIACVAITEHADAPGDVLAPWSLGSPPEGLEGLFDAVLVALRDWEPELRRGIYGLVDRLRQTLGQVTDPPHLLEVPGAWLDAAALGVVDVELLRRVGEAPGAVEILPQLAAGRGLSWDQVARATWDALRDGSVRLDDVPWLLPDAPGVAGFWCHVPGELLSPENADRIDAVDVSCVDDELLELVVAGLVGSGSRRAQSVWRTLPDRWAERALLGAPPSDERTARVAWERFSAQVEQALPALLRQDAARALGPLLALAPPAATAGLVSAFASISRDDLSDSVLLELRRWLHDRVTRRHPGFLEAYSLLATIERELQQARERPLNVPATHRAGRP